ncbi:outer membrane porin, OprD family, partial [Pseudomonas aeruginosa]
MQNPSLARLCGLLALPPALALPALAHADFIKDSSVNLGLRNIYFNRDFR